MNIFHCCVHKTGSHWITSILSDAWLRKYWFNNIGYLYVWNNENNMQNPYEKIWTQAFPNHTIISPFFTGWYNFTKIPKKCDYKAFYIMRHPKDIITSAYYSIMKSHHINPGSVVEAFRLENFKKEKNIIFQKLIVSSVEGGIFPSMVDWWTYHNTNNDIIIIKFEDLIGGNKVKTFSQIFTHCGATIDESIIEQFLQGYTLDKMRVISNNPGHYRQGKAETWVEDWNGEVEEFWNQIEFFKTPGFISLPYDNI